MPNNWKKYKLTDIGTLARGKSKHRPRDASFLYGGPYPFVQTGDIKNANHKITEYSQTYSEDGLKQSKLWPKGTICITIAANIADTAILDFDACFPDSVLGFVPDSKKCNPDFAEYLLQYYRTKIQSHSIGSVQENINLGTFELVEFQIPPLPEQQAIAEILSALDDKIELNLQMNKTLEEMASALYKHWFVDFGPFKDDKFVESELGMIPEGWYVEELKNKLAVLKDGSHNPPKRTVTGVKFIAGATDIKHFTISFDKCSFISEEDYEKMHKSYKIQKDDVLLTIVGTIGNVAIVQEGDLPFSMQRSIAILRADETFSNRYIYHILNSARFKHYTNTHINPTGQPGVYLGTIGKYKIVSAPLEVLRKFELIVNPLFDKMFLNVSQNTSLKNIRDYLLPKLISGEIRVKEAEKKIKEMV